MQKQKTQLLFDDYASYHQNDKNKLTHYIGIPLIIFSTIMLLIPFRPLPEILIGLISFYYYRIDFKLANYALGFFLVCLLSSIYLYHWPIALCLFIGGWVLQFVGHFTFEKKAPAFLKNLEHLLIGPIWILNNFLSKNK